MSTSYRNAFPFLRHHPEVVYLDSAATALKLENVLEAEQSYSLHYSTNASRGLYPLAEKTSAVVEETRRVAAQFLNARPSEIIFTRGTTDGMNMLAQSLEATLETGGEICVGNDAHHSLILPMRRLAEKNNMKMVALPVNKEGFIDTTEALSQISEHTAVLVLTLVSNVFGVLHDFETLIQKVRVINPNIFVVLDVAQAAPHIPLNVEKLGTDALVFSGHKLYGPTGVGICYLKEEWSKRLEPGVFGGGMVVDTSSVPMQWQQGPEKFEAGTLPLAQIFGLKSALEFLQDTGFEAIRKHEQELLQYALQKLSSVFKDDIYILGTKNLEQKIGLLSFTLKGVHPHDIASFLGEKNICVRAGVHCASFLHRALTIPATTRVSFGLYTTKQDIDTFVSALTEVYSQFKKA